MDIFSRVLKYDLPAGEYAVFGSALLDVWGIRRADDLDIIASEKLFAELKASGWGTLKSYPDGTEMISREDANVCTSQPFNPAISYNPDREQLVRDAVVINGVPFVRIEDVIACKHDYGRAKDHDDIASIARHLAHRAGDAIYEPAA